MNKPTIEFDKELIKENILKNYQYPYYTAGPDGKPKEIRKNKG